MTRSKLREELFKLLFRVEFVDKEELQEQFDLFVNDEVTFEESESADLKTKFDAIVEKLTDLDNKINEKTISWDTGRIGKAELTILRIAVYEILYDDLIPAPAAINEAVELAKKYGDDGASKFINGVLAKFVNE